MEVVCVSNFTSLHPRFWPVLIVSILLVFVPVAAGFAFEMAEAGGNSNGSLETTHNGNVGNNVQEVFGWSPNKKSYETATLSTSKTSDNVTVTFPAGDQISIVWIFTGNKLFDAEGILNSSSIYNFVTLASGTGSDHSNLSAIYMYAGQTVNSSALTAITDKSVSKTVLNYTVYSDTVNNLGTNFELPVTQLLATPTTYLTQYQIDLNQSSAFNSTDQVSLLFTQYLSHDTNWNILFDSEAAMLVLGLLLIGMVYAGVPRHDEWRQ